jgi:hypothetical protein
MMYNMLRYATVYSGGVFVWTFMFSNRILFLEDSEGLQFNNGMMLTI